MASEGDWADEENVSLNLPLSKLKNQQGQPANANDAAFKAEMHNVGMMGVSHVLMTASFSTGVGMTMMMMADPRDAGVMYFSLVLLGILSFVCNVVLIGLVVYRRVIFKRAPRCTENMKKIRCLQKATMVIIIIQVVLQLVTLVLTGMHMKDMASLAAEYPVTNVMGPPHQQQENVTYDS